MSTLKQFQDYGLPKPNAGSKEDVQKNINYLYSKVEQVSKNLTFWDLYKISSVVTDKKDLQSISNALLPFTSAIINTPSAFVDGDTYAVGDIIVKNQDGTVEHIRAERGGIFFPQKITKGTNNYNYTIEFTLKSNEPEQVIEPLVIDDLDPNKKPTGTWDASSEYKSKIQFKDLIVGAGASPYNIVYITFSDMSFLKAKDNENNDIQPIVKGYSSNGEEVYWDLKVTTLENNWKIEDPGTDLISTIVVK